MRILQLFTGLFFLLVSRQVVAGAPPQTVRIDTLDGRIVITGQEPASPVAVLRLESPPNRWRIIGQEAEIYEDTSGQMDVGQALRLPQSAFKRPERRCCNFRYEQDVTVWIRLRVKNEGPDNEFLLEAVNPFVGEVFFFQVDAGSRLIRADTSGAAYPFARRPVERRNFMFPVELPAGAEHDLYLVVKVDYPLSLRLLFWETAERQGDQQRVEDILLTVFFVFCALYLLLSAMLIIVAQQHFFWWYFGYVFLTAVFIPAHLGLGFRYWWPESPYLQFVVPVALNNLRLVFGIQFFRLYFDLKPRRLLFNRFLQASIFIFLIITALMPVQSWLMQTFFGWLLRVFYGYLIFFSIVMVVWVLHELVYRRRRQGVWLLLVVGLQFFGLATTSLQYRGFGAVDVAAQLLPFGERTYTLFVPATLMTGFFVEILVVFYFAVRRYTRLLEQNQRAQLRLARLREKGLNDLIVGVENERRRIARDLHDSACVNLAAIRMQVDVLREKQTDPAVAGQMAGLSHELEETYREVRGISHDLMSKALEKNDLLNALEELAARTQQARPGLEVQLYANFPLEEVGGLAKIHLYRIVQELLGNILKHARAETVNLQLLRHDDKLLLTVEDDGVGFDPAAASDGIGLANVRTRVAVLRGDLHLESAPGKGAFVSIEIPASAILPGGAG